jgi:hypothetical protein
MLESENRKALIMTGTNHTMLPYSRVVSFGHSERCQGLSQNITWSNIRAYNVSFPIFVTQVCCNQASGTIPRTGSDTTQAVDMNGFTWAKFNRTINRCQSGDTSCVSDPVFTIYVHPSLIIKASPKNATWSFIGGDLHHKLVIRYTCPITRAST